MALTLFCVMIALLVVYVTTDSLAVLIVMLLFCIGVAIHYGPWWALR